MTVREQIERSGAAVTPAIRFGLGAGLSFSYDADRRTITGISPNWEAEAERVLASEISFEEATDQALEKIRLQMEDQGLEELRRFADTVTDWRTSDGAAESYRRASEEIESAPGAAFHRRQMRDFLSQARELHPNLGFQLGVGVARSAEAWSTLAVYLAAAADALDSAAPNPSEDPFHHIESLAEAVYQYESAFCDLVSYR